MSSSPEQVDVVVIGSGPAGLNAAIAAAQAKQRVFVVEQMQDPGGACVKYGTIPSKTLRQTALTLDAAARSQQEFGPSKQFHHLPIEQLMGRLQRVVETHQSVIRRYLAGYHVEFLHGRAKLTSTNTVAIEDITGESRVIEARNIVIATGSRPRSPKEFPIDHSNILDSDSILSMSYLPQSLVVVGAGVIACEYASVFQILGVEVHIVDRGHRPLAFLEEEVSAAFLESFQQRGGTYHAEQSQIDVRWDGICTVRTELSDGQVVSTDKAFIALGRVANTDGLNLTQLGVELTSRGHVQVNDRFETNVPNILAVGDVIGPPALASCSMAQGRTAMELALGVETDFHGLPVPTGIYTIPEIATVGLTAAEAEEQYGEGIRVGRVELSETSRGQINAIDEGYVKLVATRDGQIVGSQIVGEGATELIHMAQLAMANGMRLDDFAHAPLNFPTMAECYRLAAIEALSCTPALAAGSL